MRLAARLHSIRNRIAATGLRAEYPASQMPASISVVPLDIETTGRFRLSLWLLFGSVFVILMIACINVAGLLLARGSVREREFALRRALGARRLRLGLQILTETLTLAICGGFLGLVLASAAVNSGFSSRCSPSKLAIKSMIAI